MWQGIKNAARHHRALLTVAAVALLDVFNGVPLGVALLDALARVVGLPAA